MTLPYIIAASEVDAESPVKDVLMEGIKADLDYLDGLLGATAVPQYSFVLNGPLSSLPSGRCKRVDTQMRHAAITFTKCKLSLERGGTTGTLSVDVRRHQQLNIAIQSIGYQHSDNIQSITNIAPALATQSIARNGAQISTQSIARAKTQLNIQSIINVPGTTKWRFNLNTAPDTDWQVGKTFTTASCTNAANDGTWTIVEKNQSGHPSLVVTNASGVAQTGVAGTADLNLWSYTYTNPVTSDDFTINYSHIFASHTTGANNGTFEIYKINQSGNNAWVYNASGVAQAGVAGTLDTSFWRYTYSTTPSITDFIVGEDAKMATHTTGANNGNFLIVYMNYSATNSIVVYNTAGVAQAGAAGTADTNRWIYGMSTSPAASNTVGEYTRFASATNPLNDGLFVIKEINRSALNNLVIYNESGVTQGGAAGTVVHTKRIVRFLTDQSAYITTSSRIEMADCPSAYYNETDSNLGNVVLEVNRGGGSNYNAVIYMDLAPEQLSPAGMLTIESKSIFNTAPSIAADPVAAREKRLMTANSTDFVVGSIAENTWLAMWIMSVHGGPSESVTLSLI